MPTYQPNSSSETPAPAAGANVQAIEQIKAQLEERRQESFRRPF